MYKSQIIADSICDGNRLTTFEITFPMIVRDELLTHRALSRNFSSLRAIPAKKIIQQALDNPYIPEFRLAQKGMQGGAYLEEEDQRKAENCVLRALYKAVEEANELIELGAHKQYINRLLFPYLWCTGVVSATNWGGFFRLRCSEEADPAISNIASMMYKQYVDAKPVEFDRCDNSWHTPYVDSSVDLPLAVVMSVARCARVSYLNHGEGSSLGEDQGLFDRLSSSGHWSPFEHVAFPCIGRSGNFYGWEQYRKSFKDENLGYNGIVMKDTDAWSEFSGN